MTDRPTAESLLRSRFPESEGWVVELKASGALARFGAAPYHAFVLKRAPDESKATVHLSAWGESEMDAARALIDHLDAATHRDQVRGLVRAARALIGEHPKDAFNGKLPVGGNIWMHGDWITAANTLTAALAALPDSMKED